MKKLEWVVTDYTNFILSLPRYLVLAVLLLIGATALIVSMTMLVDTQDLAKSGPLLIFSMVISFLFFVTKRGNLLKPSAKLLSKTSEITAKVNDVHKEWDVEKVKSITTEIGEKASIAHKKWDIERAEAKRLGEEKRESKKAYLQSVAARSMCKPLEVVILGGAGWDNKKGSKFLFSMDESNIYMSDLVTLSDVQIDLAELREVDISGPGKVSGNAGVMGGGFGVEGAVKGIAVATVINLLTSYSNTKTVIRLGFAGSEIVMLTSQIEPDAARILLSPLFLKINRKQQETKPHDLSSELLKLHELKQGGAITDQEFDKLKARLIE